MGHVTHIWMSHSFLIVRCTGYGIVWLYMWWEAVRSQGINVLAIHGKDLGVHTFGRLLWSCLQLAFRCVCVCVYVRVRVCVCVCVCVYVYIYVYTYIHGVACTLRCTLFLCDFKHAKLWKPNMRKATFNIRKDLQKKMMIKINKRNVLTPYYTAALHTCALTLHTVISRGGGPWRAA